MWLADESQEIARGSVKLLREFLEDKRKHEYVAPAADDDPIDESPVAQSNTEARDHENAVAEHAPEASEDKHEKAPKEANLDKLKKTIVQVRHDDRPARLLLNRRPPAAGYALLKYEDDGQEFMADLSQVQLVALVEG